MELKDGNKRVDREIRINVPQLKGKMIEMIGIHAGLKRLDAMLNH